MTIDKANNGSGLYERTAQRLRDVDYCSTQSIPSLKRPFWKVFLELHRLFYLPERTGYCFAPSAIPHFLANRFLKGKPLLRSAYYLFFLHHTVSQKSATDLLGSELFESLISEGILTRSGGIRSTVRFVPWKNFLFVSDHDEGARRGTDFYVYIGGDSMELISFINRRLGVADTFTRGLDLCAGTSIQSYNLLDRCDTILAAEVSQRAVDYATITSGINSPGKIALVRSDLWQNLGGTFDIIIANPPYVPVPLEEVSLKILDAYGGSEFGMDIPLKIIDGLGKYLNHGGYSAVLAASPIVGGKDLLREKLLPVAKNHGLQIILHAWKYTNFKRNMELQSSNDISYFTFYVIESRKAGMPSVSIKHLPLPLKLVQILVSRFSLLLYRLSK